MLSPDLLKKYIPNVSVADCLSYAEPLNKTFSEFEIDTKTRQAAFLAQVAHESGYFRYTMENLNYSAPTLLKVFPKYFTEATALEFERKPDKIANRVYANRMGNGDEASGDGWRYRGRGLIQITGKSNYADCLGYFKTTDVHFLEVAEGAARSAGWFWWKRGLNTFADLGDILSITKRINGGTNGLAERTELYKNIRNAMGE